MFLSSGLLGAFIGLASSTAAAVPEPASAPDTACSATTLGTTSEPSPDEWEALTHIEMQEADIPGLAIAVVHRTETVYLSGFGYANLANRTPVDENTAFELASTSKAFTALAVLTLVEQNRCALDDSLRDHVPWLDLRWGEAAARPTIRNFLQHTSGLPESLLLELAPSSGEHALEASLRALLPITLNHAPGDAFEYSSINYDVLGILIETVSGQSYADYLRAHVLEPAGLRQTSVLLASSAPTRLATGYKYAFGAPRPYAPPPFEGNAPAAYVLSTALDMSRWLKVQLGFATVSDSFASIVRQSHSPPGRFRYAFGWEVEDCGLLVHTGENPTFAAFVGVHVPSGYGVAVLGNVRTDRVVRLGRRILGSVLGQPLPPVPPGDDGAAVDVAASAASLGFTACAGAAAYMGGVRRRRLVPGSFSRSRRKAVVASGAALVVVLSCIYSAPALLLRSSWRALWVWAPVSVCLAALSAAAFAVVVFAVSVRPPKEPQC